MTTYDDAAINRAVGELHEWECTFGTDGKACMRGPDFHSPSYHGYVEKVFDSLERAPWWREVTDPDEMIPAGCPVRCERAFGDVTEYAGYESYVPSRVPDRNTRVFVDTRWTPPLAPPAPLAVGDLIETVEDLERLPEGAGVVDGFGDLAQKTVSGDFQFADHDPMSHPPESIIHCGPFTVVHLPKTEATE